MQLEFLQWITVYHNISSNLYGGDRAEALAVMDNDHAFDKWLASYDRKKSEELAAAERGANTAGGRSGKGRAKVSKDEFLKRMGTEKE
jgi:hypothetical protein